MRRFLINIETNWCGEDNTYSAYAKTEEELEDLAEKLAYDNFSSSNGFEEILSELFPDVDEYTDEMNDQAAEVESGYYGYSITEWDKDDPEEEWEDYELVYDGRENK